MSKNSVKKIKGYYQVDSANTLREDQDDKYNVGEIDICNASSTTDCTGLMFRPPLNEEETDSYHQIFSFGPPEINSDDNRK